MPVELADLIAALPDTQGALKNASSAATSAATQVEDITTDKVNILAQQETDAGVIANQKAAGELAAQVASRNTANLMTGDLDNKDNLMAKLAKDVHDNTSAALGAREKLTALEAEGNHSILARIGSIFERAGAERDVETYTGAAMASAKQFSDINNATITASTANDKIAAIHSTATVDAATDEAMGKLALISDAAKMEGIVNHVTLLGDVANRNLEQLSTLERVLTVQDTVKRTNMMTALKMDDEKSSEDARKMYNAGALTMGLPPISGKGEWKIFKDLPGMKIQLEAGLNAGASVARNMEHKLPDGTVVPATGNASIAPSAGESFATTKMVRAQPNDGDNRLYAYRDEVFKQVNTLLGSGITPAQYASEGQKLIDNYAKGLQKNIESKPFESNGYYQPGIAAVTRLAPAIKDDQNYQDVFGNLSDAGNNVPAAGVIAQSAFQAAKAHPERVKAIGALVTAYYQTAIYSNALVGGLNKFAMPKVNGYPVQLPSNMGGNPSGDRIAAVILGHDTVNMASDEFTNYLTRNFLKFGNKAGAK